MQVTQKRLMAIVTTLVLFAVLVGFLGIVLTLRTVDKEMRNSDVELLFSSIEAGPLEFARQYSSDFANSQLAKLLERSEFQKRHFTKVQIFSVNEDKLQQYAEWQSKSKIDSRCLKRAERTFKFPDGFFPFLVKIESDVCSQYPVTASLTSNIIVTFLFAIASTFFFGGFGLFLLFKSTRKATSILRAFDTNSADPDWSQVGYVPIRELGYLAVESIRMQKFMALAQVAQMIGHDLRAPLLMIERLLLLPPDSPIGDQKANIRQSLFRIQSMIESLRHSESELRIDRSHKFMSLESIWLPIEAHAKSKNVKVNPPPVIRFHLFADHGKIERAWINLTSNAVEFAQSVIKIEALQDGTNFILRIMDNGHGVPKEFLPKLFQRGATHGKDDGTGLGLAYVRQIMRGHGGDVTYRRENGFTVFECILPNAIVPEEDQSLENTASLEIQLSQKIIRTVAICLEPKELSEFVHTQLASLKSDEFLFIKEWKEANIVVSNTDAMMFEVMESDEQEYFSVAQFDQVWMMEILKRKFDLA